MLVVVMMVMLMTVMMFIMMTVRTIETRTQQTTTSNNVCRRLVKALPLRHRHRGRDHSLRVSSVLQLPVQPCIAESTSSCLCSEGPAVRSRSGFRLKSSRESLTSGSLAGRWPAGGPILRFSMSEPGRILSSDFPMYVIQPRICVRL